jgi:hypothetical protein
VQFPLVARAGAAVAGPTLRTAESAAATTAAFTNFLPIEPTEGSYSTG